MLGVVLFIHPSLNLDTAKVDMMWIFDEQKPALEMVLSPPGGICAFTGPPGTGEPENRE